MRRVKERATENEPKPTAAGGEKVIVPHDPINEVALISHSTNDEEQLDKLLRVVRPDQLHVREAREAWIAFAEIRRRKLTLDGPTLSAIASPEITAFVREAAAMVPPNNIEWHVENILWDHARVTAARGPVSSFIDALRDPKADRERVQALARQVAQSFDGYHERKFLYNPTNLVHLMMTEVEKRVSGHAIYSYGIPGLDYFDPGLDGKGGRRRMIPGAAPGQCTVITSVPGGGKSTTAATMAINMAFPEGIMSDAPGRRVLYAAWEMKGPMTLEIMAAISLGWSRSELMEGIGEISSHEARMILQQRGDRLATRIQFMGIPFRRPGSSRERPSNDRNLDIVEGYISDSGCDVFIADLWKRCLRDASPEAEEEALFRQQTMFEDLNVHGMIVHQQRSKDIEQREDKRPTRDGIKGSSALLEIADTMIGIHRPALWKRVPDTKLEMYILKQRYGKWPLAAEFSWDADRGSITGGHAIENDRPGETSDLDANFLNQRPVSQGRQQRRRN